MKGYAGALYFSSSVSFIRGQAVLCGTQEKRKEGGGHRGREEEADLPRLPL